MVLIALSEIFENMLQLKRFGLNFERILNRKWLYFHLEMVISAIYREYAGGFRGICSPRKLLTVHRVTVIHRVDGCNLVRLDVLTYWSMISSLLYIMLA